MSESVEAMLTRLMNTGHHAWLNGIDLEWVIVVDGGEPIRDCTLSSAVETACRAVGLT